MKYLKLILLCSIIAFASCISDDTEDVPEIDTSINEDNVLRATLNEDVMFESNNSGTKSNAFNATSLRLEGGNNGVIISMVLNNYDGVGLYTVDATAGADVKSADVSYVISGFNGSPAQTWEGPFEEATENGEVLVSTVTDTSISGTFSFEVKNAVDNTVIEVSGGTFTIEL